MAIGFKICLASTKEPLTLSKVDDEIAKELYNIEPDPKQWSRKDGFSWYDFIGFRIACMNPGYYTWTDILKDILYRERNDYDGQAVSQDEWKENKDFVRKYIIPILKHFNAKGYIPYAAGYVR